MPEIGALADALVEAGYLWRNNIPSGWGAYFTKQISDDVSLDDDAALQDEIRSIMGSYYVPPGDAPAGQE